MKQLLLITLSFPPEPSPGALRPGYIARYLPEFGWEATVLARSRGQTSAAASRAPSPPNRSALRRALSHVRNTLLFPDELIGWAARVTVQGMQAFARTRFDAILTTSPPPSIHLAGYALSRLTGTPWIADYRDLWSANPYWEWAPLKRALEQTAECTLMRRASCITTISHALADELRKLHRTPVHTIANAYEPRDWEQIPDQAPQTFDLVYTGSMCDGKRSPAVLFETLAQLRAQGDPAGAAARVHFYGRNDDFVHALAEQYGIAHQVYLHGLVPREQAMRAQRAAAGLLIFLNTDPRTANELGSKYLEYLGARRAVLVFGPAQSAMREVVDSLRIGWFAPDVSRAKEIVRQAYERFTNRDFLITPNAALVPTAPELAQAFAKVLDAAAGLRPRVQNEPAKAL